MKDRNKKIVISLSVIGAIITVMVANPLASEPTWIIYWDDVYEVVEWYKDNIKNESIDDEDLEVVLLNPPEGFDVWVSTNWNRSYDKPDYKLVITIDGLSMTEQQFREWANQTIDAIQNYNYTISTPLWIEFDKEIGGIKSE